MSGRSVTQTHQDLAAMVGTRGPESTGSVTLRDLERFALASGETSPVYFDDAAARAAGYERRPAPPVMLTGTIEWGAGVPLGQLHADGTGTGDESWLPLNGLRLMGGGQDLEFHAPVLSGTEWVAQPVLESAALKEGGAGRLILLVIATTFSTPEGAPLVTCRETLIAR